MESQPKKICVAIGSDHAGYKYKQAIIEYLQVSGYEVKDFGTLSDESVDYPIFIRPAAEAVANKLCTFGIVLGGSGNGEAIAANKVKGIRCAVCWSEETARLAKEHNDANLISIGERQISIEMALNIVKIWLESSFEGGRHERRIKMLEIND